MTTLTLTEAEVREITRRKYHRLQAEMLRALGIEHRVRPDGSILVLRAHVERLLDSSGHVQASGRKPKVYEIDRSRM